MVQGLLAEVGEGGAADVVRGAHLAASLDLAGQTTAETTPHLFHSKLTLSMSIFALASIMSMKTCFTVWCLAWPMTVSATELEAASWLELEMEAPFGWIESEDGSFL